VEIVEVLETSVQPMYGEQYGVLKSEHLLLRGLLWSLREIPIPDKVKYSMCCLPRYTLERIARADLPTPILHTADDGTDKTTQVEAFLSYDAERPKNGTAICLPTLLYDDGYTIQTTLELVGIILESVSSELNVYKRIGSFRMHLAPLAMADGERESDWVSLNSAVLRQPWSKTELQAKIQEGKFLDLDGTSEVRII
jgi:hypothetical protein